MDGLAKLFAAELTRRLKTLHSCTYCTFTPIHLVHEFTYMYIIGLPSDHPCPDTHQTRQVLTAIFTILDFIWVFVQKGTIILLFVHILVLLCSGAGIFMVKNKTAIMGVRTQCRLVSVRDEPTIDPIIASFSNLVPAPATLPNITLNPSLTPLSAHPLATNTLVVAGLSRPHGPGHVCWHDPGSAQGL